jgi:hypothetical protein
MEPDNNFNIRSGILYVALFFTMLCIRCGKDKVELSPQTHKECLLIATFENPNTSPYCLPYVMDSSYLLTQSYCSGSQRSHNSRFAYDFKMPFGTEIIAARAGEVVEYR